MKTMVEFHVWVDYTVLGTFTTLEDAVKNADELVRAYDEDYEEEDYPRIYKMKYYVSTICTYKDVSAMYDTKGNLIHDFEASHNSEIID